MKLYLAGPMTGYPEFNHTAFCDATHRLRADHHEVFSPVEYATGAGFDFTGTTGSPADAEAQGFDRRKALAAELTWICREAQGLIVLPGWRDSRGAVAEVATTHALGLPVWPLGAFLAHAPRAAQLLAEKGAITIAYADTNRRRTA